MCSRDGGTKYEANQPESSSQLRFSSGRSIWISVNRKGMSTRHFSGGAVGGGNEVSEIYTRL